MAIEMVRTIILSCLLLGLHLATGKAQVEAQQPPTFAEFQKQANVVQWLPRTLDELMCWIAEETSQFDAVFRHAKKGRDRVLLRKLSVTIASDQSWETIQNVIETIGDSGSNRSLSQSDLASVEVISRIRDMPTRRLAVASAMKRIERCSDGYASTFLLTEMAGQAFGQPEFSSEILRLFKSKLDLLDDDEAESIADDFLQKVAKHWSEAEVQVALNGLQSLRRDESQKMAMTRGATQGGRWQSAYSTTLSVNNPEWRAKLLLEFANSTDRELYLFAPSSKVSAQFKDALEQITSDRRKLELALGFCEAARKHGQLEHVKAMETDIRKFIRTVPLEELNDTVLFQKYCRAYVVVSEQEPESDADFALERLTHFSNRITGPKRDVVLAVIAEHAVAAKDFDEGIDFIKQIKDPVTQINCVNEIARNLGESGDLKSLDRFRAFVGTRDAVDRINTTMLSSLVKNEHWSQAEESVKTIRPDQTEAFEPIFTLVRRHPAVQKNETPPWLRQFKSRSQKFHSLAQLAEWTVAMDQKKRKGRKEEEERE